MVQDGSKPLKVVTRFGTVALKRRIVCLQPSQGEASGSGGRHSFPSNALLPAHEGMVITRGLQQWACLLPQELPFAVATRLLGWQAQEEALLSASTLRNLVREHGQILEAAAQQEASALLAQWAEAQREFPAPNLTPLTNPPRRRPGWPVQLNEAVDAALKESSLIPPQGVRQNDWERVLAARREEADVSVTKLRFLGPRVGPDEVLLSVDEVLTRKPIKRCFHELRTARIVTATGTRYVSGRGSAFLVILTALLYLCAGQPRSLLVIADGAGWIRDWYEQLRGTLSASTLLLDWYHLVKKCREKCCMICRGKKAKTLLLKPLLRALWQGEVEQALLVLEAHRSQAKNLEVLDQLQGYLRERRRFIPNYGQRRQERAYIGSAHVEKANDLLVAQRQKGQGMHWSEDTSVSLAVLRTLLLNGGWEQYWTEHTVMSLAA